MSSMEAFVKYLASLPEVIKRDELSAFDEDRRLAIFRHIASDGKAVTEADFDDIFHQNYVCVQPVTVTDKFSVDDLPEQTHSATCSSEGCLSK